MHENFKNLKKSRKKNKKKSLEKNGGTANPAYLGISLFRQDKLRSNKIVLIPDYSVASQFCPAKDQLNPSSKCLLTTGQRYIFFYTKSLILSPSLTEFSSEEICNLNFISNYLFKCLQYIFFVFL